jgi:hypothetical protein
MTAAVPFWDMKCNTYYACECWSPTDFRDTRLLRCQNCSCGRRAVDKLMLCRTKFGTLPTECPRSTSLGSVAFRPLVPVPGAHVGYIWLPSTDAILRTDTLLTSCGWCILHNTAFYAWFRTSQLDTGKTSSCYVKVTKFASACKSAYCRRDIVVGHYLQPDRLTG